MKANQLKNIIKEAVKEAVREEIKDILTEAVSNASKPEVTTKQPTSVKSSVTSKVTGDPIMEMLNMTQQSMTRDDFKNMVESKNHSSTPQMNFTTNNISPNISAGPQPGIDITQLDFVKNAAAIYNKSLEKDQFRVGG